MKISVASSPSEQPPHNGETTTHKIKALSYTIGRTPITGKEPKTSAKFLAIIGITPITGKQPTCLNSK